MGTEEAEWLHRLVQRQLNSFPDMTDDGLRDWIEMTVLTSGSSSMLTAQCKVELVRDVFNSFRGLDVLQPLIDDPGITEIMVNRHDRIFVERGGSVLLHPARFASDQKLRDVIQSIVGKVNRTVNESTPIVDARLADGSRVHVVLPPIALHGPTMTIRKFPERPMTIDDWIRMGSISEEAAELLEMLVSSRYNLFIGGGTGSGKTTFLNVVSGFIPDQERVITIEDSAELQIGHIPNLVRMETRNASTEGKGGVSIRDLIRASLRMRPNRIIVGEARGAEAFDMLQAMYI